MGLMENGLHAGSTQPINAGHTCPKHVDLSCGATRGPQNGCRPARPRDRPTSPCHCTTASHESGTSKGVSVSLQVPNVQASGCVQGDAVSRTPSPRARVSTPGFFRGRPPFAPFARAAAALAGEVARPARRARALTIQSCVPNTPATSAGTYRSTSSFGQWRLKPRPSTST